MKKILSVLILSGSMTMLYGYNGGSCPAQQGYYYNQPNYQGYQAPQYQGQQQYQGGQQYQAPQYQYQGQQSQGSQKSGNGYARRFFQQDNDASQDQYQGNDQQLAKKVQDSLQSAFSNKYANVKVSANRGYVTLTGNVPTQEDRASLEKKVRGIDGVVDVNNQVTVQNPNNNSAKFNGGRYGQY